LGISIGFPHLKSQFVSWRKSVGQALHVLGGLSLEYRDFDIWIEARTADGYPLRASSETQGQARGWMTIDPMYAAGTSTGWQPDEGSSEQDDQSSVVERNLTPVSIQSSLDLLAIGRTDGSFFIEFGTLLYNALFTGDIASLFQISLGEVAGQEAQGLRIRLRISPPEISVLPWEFLYSPKQKYFLGASRKTLLTRYLEVFQPIRPLRTVLPLKVLVAIPGESGLDTKKEKDILTEALGKLGNSVQPKFLQGNVTRRAIADELLEDRYHIFHFIGHGAFKGDRGHLLFNDEYGGQDLINDEIFARIFLDVPSMKLVVLNACEGAKVSSSKSMVGMAPKLIERGIPAVIAHQYSVMDEAAICFARELYRGLCVATDPGHIDTAVAHARNQLSIQFPAERSFGAPVLFMRAPNGLIFDFTTTLPLTEKTKESRELSSEERNHLENLLAIHERNRRILEEQIARMADFAPPHTRTQLEDEIAEIERIRHELGLA
jgi:hypothetical protein